MSQNPSGLRFSLRTMLITLVGFGVFAGVTGRLFLRHPQIFYVVWGTSTTVVPYVLALATLGYLCTKVENRSALVLWTIFLALVPIIGLVSIPLFTYLQRQSAVAAAAARISPNQLRNLSTPQLIGKQLPNQIEEPWVWQELERRTGAGQISGDQADEITMIFAEHMKKTKPNGWDQPLHWQRQFLEAANKRNLISNASQIVFHDAFYGALTGRVNRIRESARRLNFRMQNGSQWASHSSLAFEYLWAIKLVAIDDQVVEYKISSSNASDKSGYYEGPIPPGDHELKVVVDCAYVARKKMVGLDRYRLKQENWPKPVKAWQETMVIPFVVYGDDDEIVKLTTDAKKNPANSFAPKVVVQRQGTKKKVILQLPMNGELPVDVSFTISAIAGDVEIPLGTTYRVRQPNGSQMSGGSTLNRTVDTLDPEIRFVDIVLVPNPANVERHSFVEAIWGERVVIPNVALERFDLEGL